MMEIIKHVPARTDRYKVHWIKKHDLIMTPEYRNDGTSITRKLMSTCFNCDDDFKDGQSLAVAYLEGYFSNVLLCGDCVESIERQPVEVSDGQA